jgi:hypothetical protein
MVISMEVTDERLSAGFPRGIWSQEESVMVIVSKMSADFIWTATKKAIAVRIISIVYISVIYI